MHSGWLLSAADGTVGPVPATVPGCVHTDLLAAGLIPDPFVDANEDALRWIGRTDWVYETAFTASSEVDAERVDLVCHGLDTVATVELNGVELGRTQNMHRTFRFDVREALRAGDNLLRVSFESAYAYTDRLAAQLGARPSAYDEPFQLIRKMACNFGWDWGPNVVTAGIWQPIALESWSGARLAGVVPQVRLDAGRALVQVHINLERVGDVPVFVRASVAGADRSATVDGGLELEVERPELWWPRGYGEQPLYPLRVELCDESGTVLDTWERRIGFRTVHIDLTPDEHGTPFTLLVNDVPVFARGFNWIPDDAFVTRVTRERYFHRLGQAAGANANYLRVWGGGRYESDDFYDAADELGILVGQDFLFACAAYPEEEPLASEVEAEAREQVARLASHPSLVLWTGSNENVWGWHDWGWQERLAGRTWGAGYYFERLPAVVSEVDPTRPYWPSSPWSGSADIHPNEPSRGTSHEWDVWNRVDYVHYRDRVPRFMAEFGFQAPPAYATLRRWLSDEPLATDSPGMVHHQKADGGDEKLRRGLEAHLPPPRDFDDWHFLTQVNQARAVSLGVQHYRSYRPICMGTLVWQLNDSWPVTSWSAIDGDGRCKPLWHELRRVFADRLLTIQPRGDSLGAVAVNESGTPWQGLLEVTRYGLDGVPGVKHCVEVGIPARAAVTVALPGELVGRGLLRADLEGTHAWWFFAEDRDIGFPPARFSAVVQPTPTGAEVTVTAETILRDLTLFPDRLDPASTVDSALVTLLPGEAHTFTVHSQWPLDPTALTSRPVLRCVNDLCEGASR